MSSKLGSGFIRKLMLGSTEIKKVYLGATTVYKAPVRITNTANAKDTNALTTYTFSSQSFGPADSTRQITVAIWMFAGGAASVSSVTIGGVSATLITSALPVTNVGVYLYKAAVPTGTSGSVVVTFSTTIATCAISVYSVLNANTTVSATATDTTLSGNDLSASLAIPAHGGAIACAQGITTGSFDVTWANITERYDTQGGATTNGFSSASKEVNVAETPTITATIAATASFSSLAAVSFARL